MDTVKVKGGLKDGKKAGRRKVLGATGKEAKDVKYDEKAKQWSNFN